MHKKVVLLDILNDRSIGKEISNSFVNKICLFSCQNENPKRVILHQTKQVI